MASLLRRSKLWDSFVPPPGFESPRTAELKFLIFFAAMDRDTWWHPTEVATRVGSGNRDAARLLCLKLARSKWLDHEICYIQSRVLTQQTYILVTPTAATAYNRRSASFVVGFKKSILLRAEYDTGGLLGMFRIAKNNGWPVATRIFEYLVEYPEPILVERLKQVTQVKSGSLFRRLIHQLVAQQRLELVEPARSMFSSTCRMTASEWLKQETKRRKREEREQAKKELALRKRRRTLKKKAKAKKRVSRAKGKLEL